MELDSIIVNFCKSLFRFRKCEFFTLQVAVVTKEKVFGMSILQDDTQYLFTDEWTTDTLPSDVGKSLLQGGLFAQAIKHKAPKVLTNNAGIYITYNVLPDFGDDQQNVNCRLATFRTTSLAQKHLEAPQWMQDHAMECVVWMANHINSNVNELPKEERFYEMEWDKTVICSRRIEVPEQELEKMKAVTPSCLNKIQLRDVMELDDSILSNEFLKDNQFESGTESLGKIFMIIKR